MTINVSQVQRLLKALGHSPGTIDGIWGSKSQKALDAACKQYGAVEPTPADPQDFWKDIKYFSREELRCHCGGKYCNGFPAEPQEQLIRIADKIREHFGAMATVSSGVRCKKHNAAVGGAAGSRHRLGKAMDFSIKGVSGAKLDAYIGSFPEIRYHYHISNGYCHMDIL